MHYGGRHNLAYQCALTFSILSTITINLECKFFLLPYYAERTVVLRCVVFLLCNLYIGRHLLCLDDNFQLSCNVSQSPQKSFMKTNSLSCGGWVSVTLMTTYKHWSRHLVIFMQGRFCFFRTFDCFRAFFVKVVCDLYGLILHGSLNHIIR